MLELLQLSDIMSDMKTITAREISKNWPDVLQNNAGAEVAITNRGEVVAFLRVLPRRKGHKVKIPDFRKRIQARFGKRTLSAQDVVWLDEAMKSRY
jgi:antitoxin (DNA-binding transcriptional repressor) of toxin-antitoxin stability system